MRCSVEDVVLIRLELAELDQSASGGGLLGLLLAPAPGAGEVLAVDDDRDLEALGVVRAFLVQQQVLRRG